jgi:hypothetical protein
MLFAANRRLNVNVLLVCQIVTLIAVVVLLLRRQQAAVQDPRPAQLPDQLTRLDTRNQALDTQRRGTDHGIPRVLRRRGHHLSISLSEEHAATGMAAVNHEANDVPRPFLEAIAASEDASSLHRYGLFDLSEERDTILPEDGGSRHGLGLSLRLAQKYFFVPLGYALDGVINWSAEDPEGRGCIYLKGDQIEAVLDRIVNDAPS